MATRSRSPKERARETVIARYIMAAQWSRRALAPWISAVRGRAISITFSESLAKSNRPANQDARLPGDTLVAIPQKN